MYWDFNILSSVSASPSRHKCWSRQQRPVLRQKMVVCCCCSRQWIGSLRHSGTRHKTTAPKAHSTVSPLFREARIQEWPHGAKPCSKNSFGATMEDLLKTLTFIQTPRLTICSRTMLRHRRRRSCLPHKVFTSG